MNIPHKRIGECRQLENQWLICVWQTYEDQHSSEEEEEEEEESEDGEEDDITSAESESSEEEEGEQEEDQQNVNRQQQLEWDDSTLSYWFQLFPLSFCFCSRRLHHNPLHCSQGSMV